MKNRFLFILALLCTVMQGAWADEWDAVCWQTNTAQADWTPLSAGSTTGHTLGSAGTTTYYYITQNLNFSNSTAGGSGLTILGTVYLYIPSGLTLTCTGANASGQTGAGAGVELAEGNALYLIGSGTVNATGGNATNGGNGGTGGDATGYNGDWTETGTGGNGGNGGGGAGAGIGTHGGNGGSGGSGGSGYKYTDWKTHNGTDGSAGGAGYNASAMGNIYVYRTYQQTAAVTVNATGGAAGSTGGSGGQRGRGYAYDGYSHNYTVAGGGGGGAGGFGGAASNIGTGGPGGGGGGGGAGGAQDYRSNSSGGVYAVTAPSGKGGKNADGSSAADGTEAVTNGTAQSQGWVTVDNGSFSSSDWHYASGDVAFGNGGNGGAKGNASNASAAEYVWRSLVLGSGTESDPYQISSAADLNQLAANVNSGTTYENKYFVQTGDITYETAGLDETASNYEAIGNHSKDLYFKGHYDGANHTISGIRIYKGSLCQGLFGPIGNGGSVKNVILADTRITGGLFYGGIAGICEGGTVSNCHVLNTVTLCNIKSMSSYGGIVGYNSGGTVSGCTSAAAFTTADGAANNAITSHGGIVGFNTSGTVSDCIYFGTSFDGAGIRGAIVGFNSSKCTVTNSYYTDTNITGMSFNGTVLDNEKCAFGVNEGTITNCGLARAVATAPASLGELVRDYGTLQAYEHGLLYDGKYYAVPASISLADNADNATTISNVDGYVADVTLADRTLYKDGKWNTLCLPFDVVLEGSALKGATARPLTAASISGTTLNLTFGDAVTTLTAGTPYIIKWASGVNIENPVFYGVTIDKTDRSYDNGQSGDIRVRFLGTYKSTAFDSENKSILLMGGENMLFYPTNGAGIGAQRAYFKIGSDAALARRLTSFSIDFGDEGTLTGITDRNYDNDNNFCPENAWYSLDGRKLDGKPTRAGLYINNGNIVVIKH